MATNAPIMSALTCAPSKRVPPRFPIPAGSLAATSQACSDIASQGGR
jgi:hypothetical protein